MSDPSSDVDLANPDTRAPSPEAQQALRDAMDLHARGSIDAALTQAREVVERWPGYAQALSYLGQTLVTRKRRFADGLAVLDRAVEAGGDDPYILYSAAWCREFVANAIERPKGAHQPVAESPRALYAKAHDELLRALTLHPDEKLQGDVEDILDVIAKATGEPWDEGLYDVPHLDLGDGFRLYYEVHGPAFGSEGASTPVLLAHGAGGNSMSWWQQVPALADRYTVITFDHRGFGRSPDIEDGPGRIAFGPDVLALLDHLEVPRVHFVGHSMGGRTAFAVYNREPDRIVSFTYSGTNGGAIDDRYRALRTRLEDDGTLAGSLLSRALAPGFAAEQPTMHFLYRRIRSINPTRHPDFLRNLGRLNNARGTAATRLAQSGRPILWVVGDLDRVVHPDLIAISHDLTPGSRFHVIPESGHSGYFERADEWNATVRAFIDEVEDGRLVAKPD